MPKNCFRHYGSGCWGIENVWYFTDINDANYYLSLDWDSDGNGKRCNGDISGDFERNNGAGKLDLTSSKTQSFYLDVINTLACD